MIDAFGSQPHYRAHLAPVVNALGEHAGTVHDRAPRTPGPPVLVAGLVDAQRLRNVRPVILVEHGAGQTYRGDPRSARHGSYAGGDGWDHALGFISPSPRVAQAWRDRYDVPTAAVGSPILDRWHGLTPASPALATVAFLFHWDCALIPETRSAWQHYRRTFESTVTRLRDGGCRVVAHLHPRWGRLLDATMTRAGVERIGWADLLGGAASVLVADNSSTMYEWAAVVDRPVVVLDAPWYRPDVDHGMRFWSHVPGPRVAHPDALLDAIADAFGDDHADQRAAAARFVYGDLDGQAAARAAAAAVEMAATVG